MAASNVKAGRMPCETCGDSVWVKTTGAGKLAYRCDGCGTGHFAEKGDRGYRKWAQVMTPYADPDAADPAPADPAPPTKPPKPPKPTKPAAPPTAPPSDKKAGPFAGLLMGGA